MCKTVVAIYWIGDNPCASDAVSVAVSGAAMNPEVWLVGLD